VVSTEAPQTHAEVDTSLRIYARAVGGSKTPQNINNKQDWTVKFFTKLGQRSLYVRLPAPVEAFRFSDGAKLDPEATLESLGLLPYEMIEFRSAASD
jgi:hypothetical protein